MIVLYVRIHTCITITLYSHVCIYIIKSSLKRIITMFIFCIIYLYIYVTYYITNTHTYTNISTYLYIIMVTYWQHIVKSWSSYQSVGVLKHDRPTDCPNTRPYCTRTRNTHMNETRIKHMPMRNRRANNIFTSATHNWNTHVKRSHIHFLLGFFALLISGTYVSPFAYLLYVCVILCPPGIYLLTRGISCYIVSRCLS